jgi:DNA-binding MarR family transcriptional regulator
MVRLAAKPVLDSAQPPDVFQRIVNEIFRLHGALYRSGDRMGTHYGISASRWQVLSVLGRGPLSVPSIARRLDLKRQSVQRTVNALVEQRLVETLENPDHSRARLVRLTGEGRRLVADLADRQRRFCAECARGLDGRALVEAERLLGELRERVERSSSR